LTFVCNFDVCNANHRIGSGRMSVEFDSFRDRLRPEFFSERRINKFFLSQDVSYYAAPFIVTQAPLPTTVGDFWTMIREHQVELIVSLLGESETGADVYWPAEKGRDLALSGMIVSLVSVTVKPHWVERLISIGIPEKRDTRVLMHLQFTSWPGSLFPTSPDAFVTFVTEIINLFMQQRSTAHPVVVHCNSGIGRSGLVCLLVSAVLEVTNNTVSIPDLVSLTVKLAAWRRNILRDREHLKFAYEAFLAYMRQVIAQGRLKRGDECNREKLRNNVPK
jgi:tyrosine-protein phosphatase non-receptor type 23